MLKIGSMVKQKSTFSENLWFYGSIVMLPGNHPSYVTVSWLGQQHAGTWRQFSPHPITCLEPVNIIELVPEDEAMCVLAYLVL